MSNMNLNVNGRTVDPSSIRQIPVPTGETPEGYVKKNESLIRKNFRDELYFQQDDKLFVTEDKFVISTLDPNKPGEAKLRMGSVPANVVLIDREPEGHKVTEVAIEGASPATKDWLSKELKVKAGEKVNLHDLQKQADKLFTSNKFLAVDFSPQASDKGIKLTLKVQEVPEKIEFNGIDAKRQASLEQLFPKPLNKENIAKGMQALEKELDKDPAHMLRGLDFQVDGGKLQIMASMVQVPSQLNVRGAAPADIDRIKGMFQQPYNHESIEQGIEKLKAFYTAQGLVLPKMDFEVRGQELNLDYGTAPMPTRVEIKGMSVYRQEEALKCFNQPYSMENIQAGMQALQKKYTDDGYLLMPPEGVSADLNKGVLTINVKEAKMSDIVITGNDKTKSEVITRELADQKDKPVNLKTLDKRMGLINGTGLFANVNHSVEPDPENPDKVKLHVHTSEEKSSSVNVGAGYSMSNGPFGTASLNLGNFAGMNRKVSADVTLGTKVWGGGLSYYDPWAFNGRTSFGASVYHRQWAGPYSDEARTGAKATVGRPLGDIYNSPWRADLTFDAERIGIDKQYSVSGTGVDYRMSLRPTLTYNTLDNAAMPHEGTKVQLGVEPTWVSGRMLGKVDGKAEHYIPLGERFTLSGSAQGGTILGDAPLYEKFNNAQMGHTLLGWDSDGKLTGSNFAKVEGGVTAQIWGPISATAKVSAGDYFEGTDIKPKVGAGVGVNVKIGSFGVLNAGYGLKLYGKEKSDAPGAFHIGFGVPF